MFVAPHESLVLTVQLGRASDACIEAKGEHGRNTCLTGIRRGTGSFVPAGRCVTLFALLTPLGSVQVLDSQPLATLPLIRAHVAELLDRRTTMRAGVRRRAGADGIDAKLQVLAHWIESRLRGAALASPRARRHRAAAPAVGGARAAVRRRPRRARRRRSATPVPRQRRACRYWPPSGCSARAHAAALAQAHWKL